METKFELNAQHAHSLSNEWATTTTSGNVSRWPFSPRLESFIAFDTFSVCNHLKRVQANWFKWICTNQKLKLKWQVYALQHFARPTDRHLQISGYKMQLILRKAVVLGKGLLLATFKNLLKLSKFEWGGS